MARENDYNLNVQGIVSVTTTGDSTLIAAPGANKTNKVQLINITIASGTGVIQIEDGVGGDLLAQVAGTGSHIIAFGDYGLKQTANTLLNVVGAATTVGTITAVGYVEEARI